MAGSNPIMDKMWLMDCSYPCSSRNTSIEDALSKLHEKKGNDLMYVSEDGGGLGSHYEVLSDEDQTAFHIVGKADVYSGMVSSEDVHKPKEYRLKPPKGRSFHSSNAMKSVQQHHSKKKNVSNKQFHQASDLESVQTEDFENQFQAMMVKQVANVPVTYFDQFIIDSDLDAVKSYVIRDKFLNSMNKSFGNGSDVSTDEELEPLIEKKIQSMLNQVQYNTGMDDMMDSSHTAQDSSECHHGEQKEKGNAQEYGTVKTPDSGLSKIQRVKPGVGPDQDITVDDDASEIERQSAQLRKEMEANSWQNTPPDNDSRTHLSKVDSVHSLKLRDELSKRQLSVIRTKQEQQEVPWSKIVHGFLKN